MKTNVIIRDKDGHYIIIKGSLQQENITLVNIYVPNVGPKYIKQILMDLKGEINSAVIVGGFNTPLTSMDGSSRQEINKETAALNDTLNQMDLIDISEPKQHPKTAEYTFFSSMHRIFSRIEHVSGHTTNLNKINKTKIISNIFHDHNDMKLEISYKKEN